jgi:hypothetical protein
MSSFLLDMIGRAEGLTDAQIAKLEADAPAISQLIKLAIEAKPLIEKAQPLIAQLMPIGKEAVPLLTQAYKELQIVGPDVQMVLSILSKTTATTGSGPGTQSGGGIG